MNDAEFGPLLSGLLNETRHGRIMALPRGAEYVPESLLCDTCRAPATRYTQEQFRVESLRQGPRMVNGLRRGWCDEHAPEDAMEIAKPPFGVAVEDSTPHPSGDGTHVVNVRLLPGFDCYSTDPTRSPFVKLEPRAVSEPFKDRMALILEKVEREFGSFVPDEPAIVELGT